MRATRFLRGLSVRSCVLWVAVLPAAVAIAAGGTEPIHIGNRLELFVDSHLIEKMAGTRLELNHPQPAETVLVFDRPWEGVAAGYVTVIHDGDLYRMYYRGLPTSNAPDGSDLETTCYAESKDGIQWIKPDLGLFEVQGTSKNNVVLAHQAPSAHNFSPFLDSNPACDPSQKYKALALGSGGLLAFASPDGRAWTKLRDQSVLTSKEFAFDSQNVAFYSQTERCYVCYFRTWKNNVRWISRCTSADFVDWSAAQDMDYGDTPPEHLYTNQTHPYFRAPHLYVATAARFMPGRRVLTDAEVQLLDLEPGSWLKNDCSDVVFLSSRGGNRYDRTFMEAFVRPGIGADNWVSRSNFPALNVVQTGTEEMSLYIQRANGQKTHHMQRYTLRLDGFASVHAPYGGGEMLTKSLVFDLPPAAARVAAAPPGPVEITGADALLGSRSLRFNAPAAIELPGTKALGSRATFAAHLKGVPSGHRRLFSAYDGGPVDGGEFVIDFNSGGAITDGAAVQFLYAGGRVAALASQVGDWSLERGDGKLHHIAVTFDAGDVTIYFDGRPVGSGRITGADNLAFSLGNLRLGEDYPPTPLINEPLLGTVDDVLVLRRALSPEEVSLLSARGSAALPLAGERGLLYTMEPGSSDLLQDVLDADGAQNAVLPQGDSPAEVSLYLNYSTSAAGSIRCELQDAAGKPLPGHSLSECDEITGDRISHAVSWKGSSELKPLVGEPVRVRFIMKDADVYAIRFGR